MTVHESETIGEIVARDYRAAAVFQRHGVDFCCGGRRSLDEACREQGIPTAALVAELLGVPAGRGEAPDFASWPPEPLIDHIVTRHHAYVKRTLPVLTGYTRKLASVHGERHPELHAVAEHVEQVAAEMTAHMLKEEQVLFPYIASLAAAARQDQQPEPSPFGSVANPITMMEAEHRSAGDEMAAIRRLTGGYQVPADGCVTYRVCFQELEAFERDLHEHVHLENNILFPAALKLEAS
jgi:regulator of cell morphogenesis and NO signaling